MIRLFRRGPWENAATALIAAGVVVINLFSKSAHP